MFLFSLYLPLYAVISNWLVVLWTKNIITLLTFNKLRWGLVSTLSHYLDVYLNVILTIIGTFGLQMLQLGEPGLNPAVSERSKMSFVSEPRNKLTFLFKGHSNRHIPYTVKIKWSAPICVILLGLITQTVTGRWQYWGFIWSNFLSSSKKCLENHILSFWTRSICAAPKSCMHCAENRAILPFYWLNVKSFVCSCVSQTPLCMSSTKAPDKQLKLQNITISTATSHN